GRPGRLQTEDRLGNSPGIGDYVPATVSKGRDQSAHEPADLGCTVLQLESIAVRECLGEFFLVAYEQDALQVAAEVLQFLDHHLPAIAVQAAEALIDDDALDRPVLLARVLADAE